MKKNYINAEEMVINWGKSNKDKVNEIFVIGSLYSLTVENESTYTSDYDLLIFINDFVKKEELYLELSNIGILNGILIHPLFIKESEKEIKFSIKQYSDILLKKRKIF